MSTATLRESLDTVFTDADWVLDIAFCVGNEATPDDLDGYVHTLTLKRRTPRLTTAADPIELSTADGTLQYTAPNLVGPRVLSAQLATWVEGIYDLEQTWLRPDGVIEVVLVSTVSVIKGLSLGGSFAGLSLPANGRSLTVVRSPGQARIIRTARGPSGWNGWTPVLSVDDTTAPPKRLMKVIDWVGGGGTKPAVGSWVAVGGLTANSGTASDFGGAATAAAIDAAVAATAAAVAATADSVAKTALAVTATTNANAATAASTTQTAACAVATAAAVAAVEGATSQLIVSVSAPRYLTAADHGKLLAFVGDRPALLYVPAGLLAGFQAEIMKGGTANVFVHALPGAAVGGVAGKTGLTTQYASQRLRQISTNNYAVSDGESAAVPPSINFPDFRNARASGLALFWFA
jgi:hypothetical protein